MIEDEAMRTYAEETNRLNRERRAGGESDRKALTDVEKKLKECRFQWLRGLDTNVPIRYVVADDETQTARAKRCCAGQEVQERA